MNTTLEAITTAISTLGLEGKTLFVHSSIRSFGHLNGGPQTLIDALINAGCTVIVPTFNYDTLCLPSDGDPYQQNGYRGIFTVENTVPYCEEDNRLEPSMGAIANAVLHHPDRVRSMHPINSFSGIGPLAKRILAQQTDDNVYGIYSCQEAKGALILSMGVSLTSITPIHYAEELAGRKLFRRWAATTSRGIVETAIGSCSDGFNNFSAALSPSARQTMAGQSLWTCFNLETLLDVCTTAIMTSPSITHCDNAECERCDDMQNGGIK